MAARAQQPASSTRPIGAGETIGATEMWGIACAAGAAMFVLVGALVWSLARRRRHRAPEPEAASSADVDAVVAWISRRLPGDVGTLLSEEDVRQIVHWNLEYFRSRSAAGNGHTARSEGSVIVAGAETVEYVMSRAGEAGARYTPAQVHAVLEAQVSYLASMGVLSDDPRGAG